MPIYTVRCNVCDKHEDIYRSVKEMDDVPVCCGEKMRHVICIPYVVQDIRPYRSMVTGETISSRSAHREHLKKHNLTELGNEKIKPKSMPVTPNLKKDIYDSIQTLKRKQK